MASQSLHNYLRTFRKRSALSQKEVAYLLGTQSSANVCRHERFIQEPSLQTALAYEVIFQKPVSELFPGLFEKMQMEVGARAKKLEQREFRGNTSRVMARKGETLATIASVKPKNQLEHK